MIATSRRRNECGSSYHTILADMSETGALLMQTVYQTVALHTDGNTNRMGTW